jgi:hypothetical protein
MINADANHRSKKTQSVDVKAHAKACNSLTHAERK